MISFKENRNVRFANFARVVAFVGMFICFGAAAATPEQPFSGRWRMDTTSLKGNVKPTVIQLIDGAFKKDDDEVVKADGQFHHVSGDGYIDEQSIFVESDHVVREIDRVRGKLAYTVKYVVSPDGNSLTWNVGNYTNPDGQDVKSVTVQRRVGPPANEAHLISGKWERISISVDAKSDWIIKLNGNRFSWRTENGTGYDAIIGGKSVQIDGDNSGARALITRPQLDTIIETDFSAKGDFDDVLSMQLMPDKNTIRGVARTRKQREATTFYLHRVAE